MSEFGIGLLLGLLLYRLLMLVEWSRSASSDLKHVVSVMEMAVDALEAHGDWDTSQLLDYARADVAKMGFKEYRFDETVKDFGNPPINDVDPI